MWVDELRKATRILTDVGVASPEVDARELAEFVVGSRPILSDTPTSQQVEAFEAAVERRRQRVPLQHIIGTMWFRYLELVSRPGTFIVRPETEMVVQAGIDALATLGKPHPIVVDLCTGSGAIALSIATEVPGSHVFGVELDPQAYATAKENNARHGNPVTFINGDARTACQELAGRVDLLITNPPYVPGYHELSEEVRQDPDLALFGGGEDGLDIPRELISRAHDLLVDGGILIMEHADEQGPALRAAATGFVDVHTGQDLTGADRWLYARRSARVDA